MKNTRNTVVTLGLIDNDDIDRTASEYIADHMDDCIRYAISKGAARDKAHDLVADVWNSLTGHENNGEGFDENYHYKDCVMTDEEIKAAAEYSVDRYVKSIISKYALNDEYKDRYSRKVSVTSTRVESHKLKNGKTRNKEVKCSVTFEEVSASPNYGNRDDDLYNNNNADQLAYMNAPSEDKLEDIIGAADVSRNVEYVLDIAEAKGFKAELKNYLINIEFYLSHVTDELSENTFRTMNAKVAEFFRVNDEAKECFEAAFMYGVSHPDEIRRIVEAAG